MAAADGVDARARRVAARLLPVRARRSIGAQRAARHDLRRHEGVARHRPGAHPLDGTVVLRALEALEPDGWVVLSDVPRPGVPRQRMDHLAIGPGGVVVVDTRQWVGTVEVTRGIVQQNGFWREQECIAVARTAGAVSALLPPQHRTAVRAVICVSQHDLAEHVVGPGVHVTGVGELGRALRALPYRLNPAEVAHLATLLVRALVDGEAAEQLTTAELDPAVSGSIGAHRDGAEGTGTAPLFVPIMPGALREAARARSRRGIRSRPTGRRRWPADSAGVRRMSRVTLARLVLAALLAITVVLAGPALVRGAVRSGEQRSPVPAASLPAPAGSGSQAPSGTSSTPAAAVPAP